MLASARLIRRRIYFAWVNSIAFLLLGSLAVTASAQPSPAAPAAPTPVPQGDLPPRSLVDCLRIANERQPTLTAARASLAVKEAAYRGVAELRVPRLLAPDLPIRRQQSCRGLSAAQAELYQAEYDTTYAVLRMYFSAVYARQQFEVADDVVRNIRFWHDRVKDAVATGGGDRDINQDTVDRLAIYVRLAEAKQTEAAVGVDRALAALREAMGLGHDCAPFRPADTKMPELTIVPNQEQIINDALARRGEIMQAIVAADVTKLEIDAQGKLRFKNQARTFAAGSDLHAKSLPTGLRNGEYKPAAVGVEMPGMVAGSRESRQEQLRGYAVRADSVVEKTRILITLEAEDAYQNWLESTRKVQGNREAAKIGKQLADRVRKNRAVGNIKQEDILSTDVLAGQAQAAYNEALYHQILALANLERITAGGFIAGLVPPEINH